MFFRKLHSSTLAEFCLQLSVVLLNLICSDQLLRQQLSNKRYHSNFVRFEKKTKMSSEMICLLDVLEAARSDVCPLDNMSLDNM
jgi:hypothetical protein